MAGGNIPNFLCSIIVSSKIHLCKKYSRIVLFIIVEKEAYNTKFRKNLPLVSIYKYLPKIPHPILEKMGKSISYLLLETWFLRNENTTPPSYC